MRNLDYTFKTNINSHDREKGDSFFHKDNLFIVVEGLGGDYRGETAREHAFRIIPEAFFRHLSENRSPADAIIFALEEANRDIVEESVRLGEKMAASVSVVFIQDRIMYFSHLGDSRIYSFQGGELNQLTRDHTLKEEDPFAEKKFDDPRALRALTQGLGIHEKPSISVKKYPLHEKGLILMTTEGLTEKISNREIYRLSRKIKNPGKLANSFIDLSRRKGGNGNITIAIVKFGGLSRGLRNVILTYSAFFLIIAIIGGYILEYGRRGSDGEKRETLKTAQENTPPVEEKKVVKRAEVPQPVKKRDKKQATSPIKEETMDRSGIKKITEEPGPKLFDKIYALIGDWKSAWEKTAGKNGDLESYISFYSRDFHENRLDREGWKLDKARKGGRKDWIRIDISDIKITGPTDDNQIEVRFSQDYRSSNFSVKSEKLLLLRKEGEDWKIVSERSY